MYAQEDTLKCLFEEDTAQTLLFMESGSQCSTNGWVLPDSGTINILLVFVEYDDPNDPGSTDWPSGALPVWVDDLLDISPSSNPSGVITEYFYKASNGEFNVIGDYLLADQNGGVFKLPYNFPLDAAHFTGVGFSTVADIINSQSNGVFVTGSGITNPQHFNNWELTNIGLPKNPNPDPNGKYDHVAFILRHPNAGSSGIGRPSGSSQTLFGYAPATTQLCYTTGRMPGNLFRHEFAHFIMGGNNFHCAGGGKGQNFWVPDIGGHSMLGLANSALQLWNAWDRKWLGWKPVNNTYQISARNQSGVEVNGDLDATNPAHSGTYHLRDFASTGDALRIKLPFLNPDNEYEQWLWLENHLGYSNNGIQFDEFYRVSPATCILPAEWGLSISVQIDRDNRMWWTHILGLYGSH